jgi:uncharacterized OsmC-like protein
MATRSIMNNRQRPLVDLYRQEPAAAWVTDVACTRFAAGDPLHSAVVIGPGETETCPVAVHAAVGGDSDAPVPGDLLAAALASCFDSTLRVIADRLRLEIIELSVRVTAEVDVRGTLRVHAEVPVAFQRISMQVHIRLADGTPPRARDLLISGAEASCVVLQTLRGGLEVARHVDDGTAADSAA